MNPDRNRHNFSALLLIITVFVFALMVMRFSQIMVHGEINGEDLQENVERLYTRNHTLQANRGTIYDRHGNPIAIDAQAYKMIGVLTDKWSTEENPQHVRDKQAIAEIISKHVNLSEEEVLTYLNKDVDQVEFGSAGNDLSYQTASNIQEDLDEAGLTGIIFEDKQKRLYPNGTFSSHTVGLAQYPSGEDEATDGDKQLVGVMGLENSYNDLLTGENGARTYKKDSFGYVVPNLEYEEVEPEDGNDLYLTLDHKLQAHLETIMNRVQHENNPKNMTATVMDPETGEILATAQRPSFNATTMADMGSWQNYLTEFTFEPGSTLKIITLAAAIEEGVFNPDAYYQSGSINIHGGTVRDFNTAGWGTISYLEGVARSSNVLFVKLVEDMGHDVWKSYLDAFGFGQPTGISLPNEQAGYNPYGRPIQKVNTGFGQGISVTPVQMLQAFSAVANEGKMVQPRLVNKAVDSDTSEEKVAEPKVQSQPISAETANLTLHYLEQATNMEGAVAHGYLKEDYPLSAKTGTAQLVDPEVGGYSRSKFIYSVVGMLPAEDPQYIVYITIQEPEFTEDATYGSAVVQKLFHPLADRVIDYSDASNDENNVENIQYIETPSYLGLGTTDATQKLEEAAKEYAVIGTGDEIVQQFPYPETPLFGDQQMILMTNGAATMPDLTNWSRNDVLKVAELTGTQIKFIGEGYVMDQSLPAGSYMEPGTEITVTLSSEVNNEMLSPEEALQRKLESEEAE
jgi:penicillin-binding protein 2B